MFDKDFLENENEMHHQDRDNQPESEAMGIGSGEIEDIRREENHGFQSTGNAGQSSHAFDGFLGGSDMRNDTVRVDDIVVLEEVQNLDGLQEQTPIINVEMAAASASMDTAHARTFEDSNMANEASDPITREEGIPFMQESNAKESGYANANRGAKKKKKSVAGRAAALVASAAVFGLIAGGAMVGIQKYALDSGFLPKQTTTILGRALDDSPIKETVDTGLVNTNNQGNTSTVLDVSAIAETVMPSIVAINGKAQMTYESWFGRSQTYTTPTSGSGIIIGKNDEELLIVTNNHVVDETSELSVVFIDKSEVKATVKGGDADSDLAVIAVKFADLSQETKDSITVATIGNSDNVKVGEGVVAIGNALGYGQSVTQGIISAKDRDIETRNGATKGLIQTDAAINPGNSGGALLNLKGEVIGINSVKYSSTEVEGMGYAIPITTVEDIIKDLSTKITRDVVAEEEQGVIGIRGQDIDQTMAETYDIPQGVYVYRILENGAAVNSGLQEKDIITRLDGEKIKSMEELIKTLTYYHAGDKVTLTIQRPDGSSYAEQEIEITLGRKVDVFK